VVHGGGDRSKSSTIDKENTYYLSKAILTRTEKKNVLIFYFALHGIAYCGLGRNVGNEFLRNPELFSWLGLTWNGRTPLRGVEGSV
jgi:hypothetical protein